MKRCPTCGGTVKNGRKPYKDGDCIPCRTWFAEFKSNLWTTNKPLWYWARKEGLT